MTPFELSDELVDSLMFAMEDCRDGDFSFDTVRGIVIFCSDDEEIDDEDEYKNDVEGRYIDIPEWDSANGFDLMERFCSGLPKSDAKKALSGALDRGKGVFRAFKDALRAFPEIEKRWFLFKENEMKKFVITWYNGLREEWGLQKIGAEPSETDDLLNEDFVFHAARPENAAAAAELHSQCLAEHSKNSDGFDLADISYYNLAGGWDFAGAQAVVAETSGGDFAGYICAAPAGKALHIKTVEVKNEYRRMGLGSQLLAKLLEQLKQSARLPLTIDIPAEAESFERVVLREGFVRRSTRYSRI
jgi:ribosomal protein S18 acetylase RimI-like enzyme